MNDLIPVLAAFQIIQGATAFVRKEAESVPVPSYRYMTNDQIEDCLLDLTYTPKMWSSGWKSPRDTEEIREWIYMVKDEGMFSTFECAKNSIVNNLRYTVRHLLKNKVAVARIIEAIKNNRL